MPLSFLTQALQKTELFTLKRRLLVTASEHGRGLSYVGEGRGGWFGLPGWQSPRSSKTNILNKKLIFSTERLLNS